MHFSKYEYKPSAHYRNRSKLVCSSLFRVDSAIQFIAWATVKLVSWVHSESKAIVEPWPRRGEYHSREGKKTVNKNTNWHLLNVALKVAKSLLHSLLTEIKPVASNLTCDIWLLDHYLLQSWNLFSFRPLEQGRLDLPYRAIHEQTKMILSRWVVSTATLMARPKTSWGRHPEVQLSNLIKINKVFANYRKID